MANNDDLRPIELVEEVQRLGDENKRLLAEILELGLSRAELHLEIRRLRCHIDEMKDAMRAGGLPEWDRPELMCAGCQKHPNDLAEYAPEQTGEDMTPSAYVWKEEGTLDRRTGHFLCTKCYVEWGMPTGPYGWTAP